MTSYYSTYLKPTDDALANRWCKKFKNTAFGLNSFRRYFSGYWPEVSETQIRKEVMFILEEAKCEGIRPTRSLFNSVFEIIKIKIAVEDKQWDANPDLLVLANGTLGISTMKLVDFSPTNYVTYALPFSFNPEAKAPNWERFLSRLPEDVVPFLQEFVGLSLTTEMKYETALWIVGAPGGGKSTFLTGVETVAGARCTTLSLAHIDRSRFALTNIQGKTVGLSAEQPTGYITVTHLLNSIISGEKILVEAKYQNAVEVTPKLKLIWSMNERPRIGGGENGIFRRVKLVEFPSLPKEDRDLGLKKKIRNEGPGILLWALEGLSRLIKNGKFSIPQSVEAATAEYQHSNDITATFLCACGVLGPSYEVQAMELYSEYSYWCELNGHKPKSSTAIAEDWKRLELKKRVKDGRHYWVGVCLKDRSQYS